MASTTAIAFATQRPSALCAALCAVQVVTCVLLSPGVRAQGSDELGRLIFEVAPIPEDGVALAGNGVPGGTGAATAAGATPAQDTAVNPAKLEADISAYRARINDTQANANPYSGELREQYDALGTLLQQSGEHEEAIKAFEAAMHIDRVNAGLYTLDQIPVVEKIIASHEALGNASEVNDFHGYLFYIQQKTFPKGDPRLLAAQEEWADWNVESYMMDNAESGGNVTFETSSGLGSRVDYVAVQDPRNGTFVYIPRSQMLGVLNPLGGTSLFDPSTLQTYGVDAERVIDERLRTARDYYELVAESADSDTAADHTAEAAPAGAPPEATESPLSKDDARRVDRKLANVAYAIRDQIANIDTVEDPTSLYYNGRNSQNYRAPAVVTRGYQDNRDTLEAIALDVEQDPAATPLQKAQAWIDVGDWHVAFDFAQRSQDAYRKAWDLLTAAGFDEMAINAVFMPELLVPAPAFATHRYSREIFGIAPDASIDYRGHMDLTLDVNRYGDVAGIKIDSAVPEVSQVLRSELLDYLRDQKMRPAVVNGDTVKRENVRVRYYYSY